MNLWQAGANVMTGPGLGTEPATLEEVKAALKWHEIEQVDEGLFLIPLTQIQETELKERGHLGFEVDKIQFTLEMS